MDIHERLRFLREQLKLTKRAFGASINMSGGAITNMETGSRNVTDRTVRDICQKYNVNPDWLMNGSDPMYVDVFSDLDINDEVKQLARQYSMLSDADRELIMKLVDSLAEKINSQSHAKQSP